MPGHEKAKDTARLSHVSQLDLWPSKNTKVLTVQTVNSAYLDHPIQTMYGVFCLPGSVPTAVISGVYKVPSHVVSFSLLTEA